MREVLSKSLVWISRRNWLKTIEGRLFVFFFCCVFQPVEFIFLVVVVLEAEPKDPPSNETGSCQTSVGPDHLWIFRSGWQSNTKSRSESIHQQEKGHNERLHGNWSLCVGIFQTSNRSQNLRNSNQEVSWSLNGNVNTVWNVKVLWSTSLWMVVTWAGLVNVVLQDGGEMCIRDSGYSHRSCRRMLFSI